MITKNSNDIIKDGYTRYIRYTTESRNFPSIVDGCKPVHRRCIHQIFKECPTHFVKSTTAIGAIVKAHPHPSSIFGALVPMTQNDAPFKIFDGQGNWGSICPPSEASAERYVEIKISDLASKIFESFSNYVEMIEGDLNNTEPKDLATFLPLAFLNGSYAIPVGMSTVDIPPLNAVDLCEYAIKILEMHDLEYIPDMLIKPNLGEVQIKSTKQEWKNLLKSGQGKITILPKIEIRDSRTLVITALPETKTIDHVNKILASELLNDQINIRDETTTKLQIVVEILPHKKVNVENLSKTLLNKLTVNKTYRFIFNDNGVATFCGVPTAMRRCLQYLIKCATKWSQDVLQSLNRQLLIYTVINKLKQDKNIEKLYSMTKDEAITFIADTYTVDNEIATSVINKPISYLTKAHNQEIETLKSKIKDQQSIDDDIYIYLIACYRKIQDQITRERGVTKTTFFTSRSKLCKLLQ